MALKSNDWIGMALSDGRYTITAKLGEGGMGLVYRARDNRLGMDVVIKVPRQAMLDDPEFGGRFAREIRSLVRLSHPCIVKVTDVGQHEGLPFAIMQYLPGGSLEDRLLPAGGQPVAVDPKTMLGWLQGVASALDYVHAQGFVHRDVKPGNILFDSQGYSFLGDFGVIKAMAATEATRSKTVTGAGLVLGTPEYMAPELIMGGNVDGRVDQYALAVTVYEALCGRRPFEGTSATAVLVLQTTQPPVPLNEVRPNLPAQLSQAVLKGLAKDAAQRYPSCTALAAAVAAAVEASPAFAPGGAGGASAPTAAAADSVKILCPSCGKRISMGIATYSNLKRTGKSFACPKCEGPVQVASERTQILSAPFLDPSSSRSGTQLLPGASRSGTHILSAAALGETAERAPAGGGGPARTTEKIEIPNLVPGQETGLAPTGRVKTQIVGRAAPTQILPQSQDPEPLPAAPSRLPWIIMGATVALLLIAALTYALLPRGSREATLTHTGNTASGPGVAVREPRPEVPKPIKTASADSLPPAATPATGAHETSAAPNVDPARPPAFTVPNAASAASRVPTPAPPPALETVVAARDTLAAPDPVAPVPETNNPEVEPAHLASSSTLDANKRSGKRTAGPALEAILAEPEKYGDQEIVPQGLFRVGKHMHYAPDGTTTIAVNQSGLKVKMVAPQTPGVVPLEGGNTLTMEIERDLADRFIAHNISTRGNVSSLTQGNWHSNLAMLTVRVLRSPGTSRWVCRILKAEFLLDFDLRRIGQDLFKHSFLTLAIAPGAEHRGAGDGDVWKERVGLHFTNQIKGLYRTAKTQQSLAKWAQFNMQMGQMINSTVRNASAANAADEAARRSALLPK
jgi:serine/threonine-protein kinase